jgi:flagellar biosynthesis protein FlhA
MTLDPALEQLLLKTVQQSAQQTGNMDTLVIEPSMADAIQRSLMNATQEQENAGRPAVLVVSSQLRPVLSRFIRNTIEHLSVLSYQEIPDNKTITIVSTVGAQ